MAKSQVSTYLTTPEVKAVSTLAKTWGCSISEALARLIRSGLSTASGVAGEAP